MTQPTGPLNWRPLKHFCSEPPQYGLNISASEYTENNLEAWRLLRTTDIREDGSLVSGNEVFLNQAQFSSKYQLRAGDLLYSRSGTVGRSYLCSSSSSRFTFAGYLVRFRPRSDVDPQYLDYCSRTTFFKEAISADSVTSTISNFNAERYKNLQLPWRTTDEQRRIADYLDRETTRIDALIVKKRRMIRLLEQRWEAWVRDLLDSLTCTVLPLKRYWRVIDCKHRTPIYVDDGYPVVSPGDTLPGRLDLGRAHRFVDEADYRDLAAGTRRPRRGDIIYSRNASIGIASYVDTNAPFCMGQDVCLITSDNMDQLFLMYALNSIGLDQLEAQKIGSTFSRVNVSQILEILVPVPSLDEQQILGGRFDLAASRRSRACETLKRQIDLLQERRQTLITAVVTGETSVRTVAAWTRLSGRIGLP